MYNLKESSFNTSLKDIELNKKLVNNNDSYFRGYLIYKDNNEFVAEKIYVINLRDEFEKSLGPNSDFLHYFDFGEDFFYPLDDPYYRFLSDYRDKVENHFKNDSLTDRRIDIEILHDSVLINVVSKTDDKNMSLGNLVNQVLLGQELESLKY